MEILYDAAMWVNELGDQMGVWAFTPFILGAGLVGLKMKKCQ